MEKSDNIKLNMLGLPVIQSIGDFSNLTHISDYTIYQLSNHANRYYKTYSIPKKSGKPRTINQPNKKMKGLQSWILVNLLDKLKVSSSCKGFEKNSSTADNVEPHLGANTIVTLDLKDFFHSVKRNQVMAIFKAVGYNNLISTILTNLCTYKGALPQGGPCSPKLANLAAWPLDVRIQGYVGKRGISYTRYADDLSFSGLSPAAVVRIIPMIKSIVRDEKFEVNDNKTRVAGAGRARRITGLTLSDESFGIGKQKFKTLRAKIHHLTLPAQQKNTKLVYEVSGWLSYLNSVDKKRLESTNIYIRKLAKRYPDTLLNELIPDSKPAH